MLNEHCSLHTFRVCVCVWENVVRKYLEKCGKIHAHLKKAKKNHISGMRSNVKANFYSRMHISSRIQRPIINEYIFYSWQCLTVFFSPCGRLSWVMAPINSVSYLSESLLVELAKCEIVVAVSGCGTCNSHTHRTIIILCLSIFQEVRVEKKINKDFKHVFLSYALHNKPNISLTWFTGNV